jgi:hypothetical protein
MLLGSVPKKLIAIANSRTRTNTDCKLLETFYGKNWKDVIAPSDEKLMLDAPYSAEPNIMRSWDGGYDGGFDNYGGVDLSTSVNFDAFDDLEGAITDSTVVEAVSYEVTGYPTYLNISVYAEDTFENLKDKIYVATNIPPYRQHIFFAVGESTNMHTTYTLTLEGALVPVSIARDLRAGRFADSVIAGAAVDRRLEAGRDEIQVTAYDAMSTMEVEPGEFLYHVYVVDLYMVLKPTSENKSLINAFADRYQFDVLYYGLIMKYWPQLTKDAFRLAMTNAHEMDQIYPRLSPGLSKTKAKIALEAKLLDATYADYVRAPKSMREGGVSINSATYTVPAIANNYVSPRNIFDLIETNANMPIVVCRLVPNAAIGVGNTRNTMIIAKKHVSAYSHTHRALLDRFAKRAKYVKRLGIEFLLLNPTPSRVIMYLDGQTSIETTWVEDDRIGFDEAIKDMRTRLRAVTEQIQRMGSVVSPNMRLFDSARVGRISKASVAFYWDHAFTTSGFHVFKEHWKIFESAGIVKIDGLQQSGAYVFHFKKGVSEYDTKALERALSHSGRTSINNNLLEQKLSNTYNHLTDLDLAQKWDYVYQGRLIRMYPRGIKTKIEVVGASMREFEFIRLTMLGFLNSLTSGHDAMKASEFITASGIGTNARSTLQALQDVDPELYDLKRRGEAKMVYSVVCQTKKRQPVPRTTSERVVASVEPVKYWNMTRNEAIYYSCINKNFPHLGFIINKHPLGYCLPCCKQGRAPIGSKEARVNEVCMSKYKFTAEDARGIGEEFGDIGTPSKHILTYGKTISNGRLGHVPDTLVDGILHNALITKNKKQYIGFRLLGVEQTLPALGPHAGFAFALAAIVERPIQEMVQQMANIVLKLPDTFGTIANGDVGRAFHTPKDIADALVSVFVDQTDCGIFEQTNVAWRLILQTLARLIYNIEIVILKEREGGNFELLIDPRTEWSILSVPNVAIGVIIETRENKQMYPLVVVNQIEFLRAPNMLGAARRAFVGTRTPDSDPDDRVVDKLRDIILSEKTTASSTRSVLDIYSVSDALEHNKKWVIYRRLISKRDFCYALLVRRVGETGKKKKLVYIAIEYSAHASSTSKALYEVAPARSVDITYSISDLKTVIDIINVDRKSSSLHVITPNSSLIDGAGMCIGFESNGIYYYHDAVKPAAATAIFKCEHHINIPYHPWDINNAISKKSVDQVDTKVDKLANQGMFANYGYRLLAIEFATLGHNDRDENLREQLKTLILTTNIESTSSMRKFKGVLAEICDPADARVIRKIVVDSARGGVTASEIVNAVLEGVYNFDMITNKRVAELIAEGATDKLITLIDERLKDNIELISEKDAMTMGVENIMTSCKDKRTGYERPQCINGKLAVLDNKYMDWINILAADLGNKYTTGITSGHGIGRDLVGVIDELNMSIQSGERLELL